MWLIGGTSVALAAPGVDIAVRVSTKRLACSGSISIMRLSNLTYEGLGMATTTREHGAPSGYDRLRRYLPQSSQRRTALGVKDNTITKWDRNAATRIRRESETKVSSLLWACEHLESLFDRPEQVGEFLLTPQAVLHNRRPIGVIRIDGEHGARALVDAMSQIAEHAEEVLDRLALDRLLTDDAAWDQIDAGLSDAGRARATAAARELAKLRRSGGSLLD